MRCLRKRHSEESGRFHLEKYRADSPCNVNCSVSVRVRPLASSEKESAWRMDDAKIVPLAALGSDATYQLDNVFDESWTTAQVSVSVEGQ